jgi:hypothetical protein
MPSSRYSGLFGAMLTLAGCAVQPQQSPGVHFVGDPQSAPRLSTDGRALRVAFAYNADFMKGGMAGVIHDIERRYRKTTSQVGAAPDALRDCMTLDYTAYNIDQLDGRQIDGAPLPFFTDGAVKARLAHYGPLAACRTRDFQPLDFAAGVCPAVDGCKNALDWASAVTACMFSRLGTG